MIIHNPVIYPFQQKSLPTPDLPILEVKGKESMKKINKKAIKIHPILLKIRMCVRVYIYMSLHLCIRAHAHTVTKREGNFSLPRCWYQLTEYCCWCLARRTWTSFLFIICLDTYYLCKKSNKGNRFTLKMTRSRKYPAETLTDADYVND